MLEAGDAENRKKYMDLVEAGRRKGVWSDESHILHRVEGFVCVHYLPGKDMLGFTYR